jgi:osmotically-inducible protein OsmY
MAISDEKIQNDIFEQLIWDNRLDESDINVRVEDGAVMLQGTTTSLPGVLFAEEDAWQIRNVDSVINQLTVHFPEGFNRPSDDIIKAAVENFLYWNRFTDTANIKASVRSGWLNLDGQVDALWKKVKCERLSSGISGVVGITNKLKVVPPRKISDREIADDVVGAIRRNALLTSDFIDVSVDGSIVFLAGTVPNKTAHLAVLDIVRRTSGCVDIIDRMAIKEPVFAHSR